MRARKEDFGQATAIFRTREHERQRTQGPYNWHTAIIVVNRFLLQLYENTGFVADVPIQRA